MEHLVGYILPTAVIGLCIPMVLAMVPPNAFYGFRTPRTLSSPRIWYAANRVSGWFLIVASALTICFNLALWWIHPDWPEKRLVFWMANAMAVSVFLAVVASFMYLRRL